MSDDRAGMTAAVRKLPSLAKTWLSSSLRKTGNYFSRVCVSLLSRHFRRPPLGEVLVKQMVITRDQLESALEIQKKNPQLLGQIILEQGFATERDILQAIANEYQVSTTSLSDNIAESIKQRPPSLSEKLSTIRIPIRVRLSIAITFIIWLTILILSFVILARQKNSLYRQTVKTGKVSLNYFATNTAVALLEDDIVRLNGLIKEAASVEGLAYAVVVDREGTIKAHSDPGKIGSSLAEVTPETGATREEEVTYFRYRGSTGEHLLNLSRTVRFGEVDLGEVNVGISLDFIDRQIRRESINIIALSLFIVLLGVSIAILIGIGFSRPISQLVLATKEIGRGNFRYRIERVRRDELGDLAIAFNYMSRELWKKLIMQKSFGSYVSPEILGMILAQPEDDWLKGARMEVSILFTDIRGFTEYAETNEPEKVVEAVNEYFHITAHFVDAYGGYVDKFIGDAVLGVFGAPIARTDHADRAVRAAISMQREFQKAGRDGNPFLGRVGIAVNSGEAVAGDLGSELKKQYSVIGDCVNLASRLNTLAGPGQIIITRSTYTLAQHIISANALPPAKVKGKAELIDIFEVVDLKDNVTVRSPVRNGK